MEAVLYHAEKGNTVRCDLCNHHCVIKDGKRGLCHVRENRSGILHSLVFGRVIAQHVDPIEKKPLFHVKPGSLSYSVATVGCNFRCQFCQNASIAQAPADNGGRISGESATPEEIVKDAHRRGCASIAYTYTEPTIYFEFALATAKAAKPLGIRNVFVTNGYMTREAIEMISPYLDAANVDLKAFSDDFYKTYCGAKLEPVKESLKAMKAAGIFVEVTTLLIPDLNDDPAELEQLAGFIKTELGPETPWHISRFHPSYKLADRPPTPVETLMKARDIGARAGLRYVYTGNVPGNEWEHTFCYRCKEKIIERLGFQVRSRNIENGACAFCGAVIDGIGL